MEDRRRCRRYLGQSLCSSSEGHGKQESRGECEGRYETVRERENVRLGGL
jgi:hypothetical protein